MVSGPELKLTWSMIVSTQFSKQLQSDQAHRRPNVSSRECQGDKALLKLMKKKDKKRQQSGGDPMVENKTHDGTAKKASKQWHCK